MSHSQIHSVARAAQLPRALLIATAIGLSALLGACADFDPPKPIGVTDIAERPAERALLGAMRAYDEADYPNVERRADEALRLGLQSPRDVAMAHKLRAFVYCTSNRLGPCEKEFRVARTVDPSFALTKAEAGHPVWGPVYRRSLR